MNVILEPEEYANARAWLRTTEILWRDMGKAARVPSWGEVLCDKTNCIGSQTCSEIAYNLLKKYYPDLSLSWRKDEFALLDHRAPKVFSSPLVGQLYYLDIKSAYKQLYQHLFLHSDFPFKRQKYPLWELAQEFNGKTEQEWKIARNCIIGITRSTKNKWVRGEKIWETRKVNKYLSPTLWAQLMGILNQIAAKMLDYNAAWINTDGYVFTTESDYLRAIEFFRQEDIIIGDKGIGQGYINGLHSVHIDGVKNTLCTDKSTTVYHVETSEIDYLKYWQNNRKVN